jgi:HD-like signal output (HDOD) protein
MSINSISSIQHQISEVTALISLPDIYLKIRQLMADEYSEIEDFAEVVRLDPNLSLAVLKMVNSAFFGFPKKVENVLQATNLIGIGQLHAIVLGLSAVSTLNWPNSHIKLKAFWRGSLFTGVLAQLLAKRQKIPKSESMFIKGLLHDVGHMVLYAKFPELTGQAIEIAKKDSLFIHEAECQVFSCHYGDIGAMLLAQWGLSDEYQIPLRQQPHPIPTGSRQKEACVLHLARAYAQQHIGVLERADIIINPIAWTITDLTPEDVKASLDEARTISADMESIIIG